MERGSALHQKEFDRREDEIDEQRDKARIEHEHRKAPAEGIGRANGAGRLFEEFAVPQNQEEQRKRAEGDEAEEKNRLQKIGLIGRRSLVPELRRNGKAVVDRVDDDRQKELIESMFI